MFRRQRQKYLDSRAYESLVAVDSDDVDPVLLVEVVLEVLAQVVESPDRCRIRTERLEARLVALQRCSQPHSRRSQNTLHLLAQDTLQTQTQRLIMGSNEAEAQL